MRIACGHSLQQITVIKGGAVGACLASMRPCIPSPAWKKKNERRRRDGREGRKKERKKGRREGGRVILELKYSLYNSNFFN